MWEYAGKLHILELQQSVSYYCIDQCSEGLVQGTETIPDPVISDVIMLFGVRP